MDRPFLPKHTLRCEFNYSHTESFLVFFLFNTEKIGEEGNDDVQSHKRNEWNQEILEQNSRSFESIHVP